MEKKRLATVVGMAVCVIFAALAPWLIHGRMPWRDGCVAWVFDVGQGDGIFLDCPGGQVVIDGGPSESFSEHLSEVMPFWDRSINLVINTHPHADHYVGLIDVLDRYRVGQVWTSGQGSPAQAYENFMHQDVYYRAVQAGDAFSLGEDIVLTVVSPKESYDGQFLEDPNAGSLVVLLSVRGQKMLFTGDAGTEQEQMFMQEVGDIDILKVGHHGSLTSSDWIFLQEIDPEVAIFSVGENSYGHPHPVVLDRFERLGIDLLRTDEEGSVRIDVF